jgi:hypothetical protein
VRMQAVALCHDGVVGELIVLRAAISSAVERVLGHSPGGSSRVEAVNKLIVKL